MTGDMSLTGPTGDVLAASSSAAPEEILPTPADGGIYSDDCNQAFSSRLHWDNTFTVKKEMEETPPASTGDIFCPEDYDEMSLSLLDLEGQSSGARLVKKEPDEFAADLGMEDEGMTSEAFDSTSSLPLLLEKQRRDGSLRVIEVPNEILPTPAGGAFRSEDCNRVTCPQPDLEGHSNNSCVVKQGKLD
ncbi:hypothetical protein HPB47_027744 [Ixodes persulcatus]|uniref:Uncharacterized protein n=1 Tax=Ixodes persulcatus TaxID=34615 RepID=A0AC60PVL0_IXOPE|nr:hypothetical protein HPB47_027744 [Ixodes persulcatus]